VSTTDNSRALRDAASVEPLGQGHFGVSIAEDYTVFGRPNGGYLQCVMANAALAGASELGDHHLHALAVSTNFSGACDPGPAELHTSIRHLGRGASFVHVTLSQHGVVTTESLVTLGTLRDGPARHMDATPPVLSSLQECQPSAASDEIKIARVVELRLDPSCAGWPAGDLSMRGEVLGWLRLDDAQASWDPWSMLFASDALPPATFPLGSSGWVPTLQLTSYVRRIPTSEWLRARQWCVVIADGMVDERCELFDARDELVASSSQLAMVRFPRGH